MTTSLGIAHHAREGDHLDESLVEVSMTLLRFLSMALLPVVAACGIIDHRVDPGPLPPIDQQDWVIYDDAPRRGTPVTSPSPRGTVDGQWEPYRRTVRTGNWKGNSAWRYPPKVRDTRTSTSGERCVASIMMRSGFAPSPASPAKMRSNTTLPALADEAVLERLVRAVAAGASFH